MPKVSVIIPVYNTEKYLRECLDSVVNQTLKDIEIICIDDGSTDSSLSILKEYAKNDSRFIILSQENQGAGATRNKGLDIAKGEYLSFLDSDDFFEPDMLEKVYNHSKQYQTDITIFNCYLYDDENKINKSVDWTLRTENIQEKEIFNYKDIPDEIFTLSNCWVWNRLYNREFILENNIKFQLIKYQNDVYFSCISMVMANNISYLNEKLVHYRNIGNNEEHLASSKTIQKYPIEMCNCLLAIYEKLNEINLFEKIKHSYFSIAINGLYWCYKNLIGTPSYESFLKYIKNNFVEIFQININLNKIHCPKKYKLIKNICDNKIPPIIHYCWFGSKPKTPLIKMCIKSWKKFLPDYEIKEWNDKDLENINNDYVKEAIQCNKWAFVSDYMRLYAVYNYGGIYFDTDNEVFKSFDEFLNLDFFTGYELYNNRLHPFTAVFGAKQNNKIVGDLLFEYNNIHFFENGKMDLKTNTKRVSEYFANKYGVIPPYTDDSKIYLEELSIIYPSTTFCEYKKGTSYAVHHFNASWHNQKNKKSLLQKIFSIKNKGVHKQISFLGIQLKIKSKKLVEREQYKVINKKLDKINKKLKIIEKELINAEA